MSYRLGAGVLVSAIAGVTLLGAASDDDEAMSAARPGFSEPTDTIPPGWMQFEGGLAWSYHALVPGPSQQLTGPFSLLRIGITSFAEVRIGADGFTSESDLVEGEWTHHQGGSDLQIAGKVRFCKETTRFPALSLVAGLSAPTGNEYFSSGRAVPLVTASWSKALPFGLAAGGSV